MTMWNDRLLPHPLLAPWTDDYGDATFVATVPHAVENNGRQINLTIKYHLTASPLRELISRGQAQYVGLLTCSNTFSRNTYATSQEDDLQILEAGHYAGELKLTPYIVTLERIPGFISGELAEEIREIKPEGFNIPPGSIMAVGESTIITLEEGGSPHSVIDLVSDQGIDQGSLKVDLDDRRIKIHLAAADKERIENLRGQESRRVEIMATLFSAIYLHAVTEALRNLPEHADRDWAYTMRQALDRNNISVNDEELTANPLIYAQTLMAKPIGTFLTAFGSGEED